MEKSKSKKEEINKKEEIDMEKSQSKKEDTKRKEMVDMKKSQSKKEEINKKEEFDMEKKQLKQAKAINGLFYKRFEPTKEYVLKKETNLEEIHKKYEVIRRMFKDRNILESTPFGYRKGLCLKNMEENYESACSHCSGIKKYIDEYLEKLIIEDSQLKSWVSALMKGEYYIEFVDKMKEIKLKIDAVYEIICEVGRNIYEYREMLWYGNKVNITLDDCINLTEMYEELKLVHYLLDKLESVTYEVNSIVSQLDVMDRYVDILSKVDIISYKVRFMMEEILNIVDIYASSDIFYEYGYEDEDTGEFTEEQYSLSQIFSSIFIDRGTYDC